MTGCGRKIGPYDCCTVVCGDCLELMKSIPDGAVDAVVTDPVWPNSSPRLIGADRPYELFEDAAPHLSRTGKRLCVHLGCNSDPRFLKPVTLPFFRVCWLDYARPDYRGRLLYASDVAYLFGQPPIPSKAHFLIPGRYLSWDSNGKQADHPCPRKLDHVEWLVDKWSSIGETILDPFLGSGTTAVAAKKLGRHFLGFEISPEYCRIAEERIARVEAQPSLFDPPPTTPSLFQP